MGWPRRRGGHEGRTRSLRRRVLLTIVAVEVLAVALFVLPLGWLVGRSLRQEQVAELEREATSVLALLPDRPLQAGDELPGDPRPGVVVGIYRPDGTLLAGTGPAVDADAVGAQQNGVTRLVDEGPWLAAYVPFRAEGEQPVAVRAASASDSARGRTLAAWGVLLAMASGVVAVAAGVAVLRSRTLARPFEQLAGAARDLGAGAFALQVPATGITEAEDVARALESSASRLGERIHREQRLAADISHQLRTPVTAARLTLESALADPVTAPRDALQAALAQVDRLESTIDDLVSLSRGDAVAGQPCDVGAEIAAARQRWQGLFRRVDRWLIVDVEPGLPPVQAPSAAVRQILDVLLDNARRHGAGPVTMRARDLAGAVAVDLRDEGSVPAGQGDEFFARGRSPAGGTGIGLALARDLAEAQGGRLFLASRQPTVFTVVLPASDPPAAGAPGEQS